MFFEAPGEAVMPVAVTHKVEELRFVGVQSRFQRTSPRIANWPRRQSWEAIRVVTRVDRHVGMMQSCLLYTSERECQRPFPRILSVENVSHEKHFRFRLAVFPLNRKPAGRRCVAKSPTSHGNLVMRNYRRNFRHIVMFFLAVSYTHLDVYKRQVEAAGDVNTLLLDKTGTITLGNRQAAEFIPAPGITTDEMADAAQLSSLADETPEGRSIVVLAKERYQLRGRELASHEAVFIPFSAQTRMSGVNLDGREIRKGAVDAITKYLHQFGTCLLYTSRCV